MASNTHGCDARCHTLDAQRGDRLQLIYGQIDALERRSSKAELELNASLDAVMAEVTEVLDTGAFFPRVSEAGRDQKPTACTYCAVREACLVEDSSMRRTLMRQVQDKASNPAEQARWALWWRGRGQAE